MGTYIDGKGFRIICIEKCNSFPGKLNLFYSEALPPRVPVILQDELFDEHELGGHGGANKQPVLLREDLTNGAAGRGNIIATTGCLNIK